MTPVPFFFDLSKSFEVRGPLPAGDLPSHDETNEKERVGATDHRELDAHRLRLQHRHEIA